VNYDGAVTPVASNRLIVKADVNGNVCFYTLRPAALVVDVNAVSDVGISSFPNYRIDTRNQTLPPGSVTLSTCRYGRCTRRWAAWTVLLRHCCRMQRSQIDRSSR
jgi:hypothetical protein